MQHTYTLRNVKTGPGMENDTLRATIVCDGKPVGTVEDWGTGGEYMYRDVPDEIMADLRRIGTESYKRYCEGHALEMSTLSVLGDAGMEDIFIGDLVNEYEQAKFAAAQKRKAAAQVIFVLDGDDPDHAYRSFPKRVARDLALAELRKAKYAAKHPRILSPTTGQWEAL